ncbi:Uncharacterized protein GBIM_01271 [Gryllus bimaculatus]|nr:Uncharacterized protein GBIM_01271 [Gryllus bimaculatus]
MARYAERVLSARTAVRVAVAHLNLGRLLERRGRCAEALAAYRRCSQLDGAGLKDPLAHEAARLSALLHLGRLYAEQGLHQEAMAAYQEALDSAPEHFPPQGI